MAIKTRPDYFGAVETGVVSREILKTSRLIERMSGLQIARSKAIVGLNAFAHGSGIHQDGILKKRETYEIMDPEEVGWGGTELPLTKHSGRHAMVGRLEHLGFKLTDAEKGAVFVRFKEIGDKKKFVYDDDLSALVDDSIGNAGETYALDYIHVTSGSTTIPTATVRLKKDGEPCRIPARAMSPSTRPCRRSTASWSGAARWPPTRCRPSRRAAIPSAK